MTSSLVVPASPEDGASHPVFKVVGIFVHGPQREALMDMGGLQVQVKEGQNIRRDILVAKITPEAVQLKYADGKEETVNFGP